MAKEKRNLHGWLSLITAQFAKQPAFPAYWNECLRLVRGPVRCTTAERPIQPAVEDKQFRMGSASNNRCQVRAVGDEGRMARKLSRNMVKARALVERRPYTLIDAVPLIKKAKYAKFDETVDLNIRLGVDPKHADQMVRGTVVLPHGLGKTKVVAVITSGDKVADALAAGAEFAGGDEMVEKIQKENWTAFDALIATPDMMKSVGRLGKVLGPKGLMPNPKTGTVTTDVVAAIKEIKAGKVEFRTDKTALVHVPVGKLSFEPKKLVDNAMTVISSVLKAKPAAAKGRYVKGMTISSTMGPGVQLDAVVLELAGKV